MIRTFSLLLLSILFTLQLAHPLPVQAGDTAARLQMAVKRMSTWLGADENAMRWRQALLLNILESQSAKGDRAETEMLQLVLQRFESNMPGVEHPAFVDVRDALRAHYAHIEAAAQLDVPHYLSNLSQYPFRDLSVAEIDEYRQDSIYFLELFGNQYRNRHPQDMCDTLFAKLKLDETLERLKGLEIGPLLPSPIAPFEPTLREPAEDSGLENEEEKALREQDILRLAEYQKMVADQDKERLTIRAEILRALIEVTRAFEDDQTEYLDVYYGSARLSLDRFVRLLAYSTDRNLPVIIDRQLAVIAENYPLLGNPNQRSAAAKVGDALGYLESSLQHTELATAIRRKFSLPNAVIEIRPNLFAEQTTRTNAETLPVNEIILGRQILGNAFTTTRAGIELLNDPHQIAVSIHLQGNLYSDTYTKQGPITAFTGSNGVFEGRRNVFANVGGFYSKDPYVAANIQSYFKNVNLQLKLINRIAEKQFLKDKVRGEGIAAARAEMRIDDEFRQQTDEAIDNGRTQLEGSSEKLDSYRTAIPSVYAFSQSDRIEAHAHKVDAFHLAATSPPQPGRVPADVRVRLHESMMINFVDPLFVGKTLSNTEIAETAEKLLGSTPDAFADEGADEEPWSITFSRIQPFQFELDANRLKVGIIGERFTRGTTVIRSGMIIKLTYAIVRREGKLYLVRDGKATVDYADPTDQNARAISFKTFLEKKLNPEKSQDPQGRDLEEGNGLMPNQENIALVQEDDFEGLELPANLIPVDKVEALKDMEVARNLQLVELRMEGGWLYVGWNRSGPNSRGMAIDTPAIQDYVAMSPANAAESNPSTEKNPEGTRPSDAPLGDK